MNEIHQSQGVSGRVQPIMGRGVWIAMMAISVVVSVIGSFFGAAGHVMVSHGFGQATGWVICAGLIVGAIGGLWAWRGWQRRMADEMKWVIDSGEPLGLGRSAGWGIAYGVTVTVVLHAFLTACDVWRSFDPRMHRMDMFNVWYVDGIGLICGVVAGATVGAIACLCVTMSLRMQRLRMQ